MSAKTPSVTWLPSAPLWPVLHSSTSVSSVLEFNNSQSFWTFPFPSCTVTLVNSFVSVYWSLGGRFICGYFQGPFVKGPGLPISQGALGPVLRVSKSLLWLPESSLCLADLEVYNVYRPSSTFVCRPLYSWGHHGEFATNKDTVGSVSGSLPWGPSAWNTIFSDH